MKRILKFTIFFLVALALFLTFYLLAKNGNVQLLNPQGYIAQKESILLLTALLLGIFLGIPVVFFTLFIAFKYRESNTKTVYAPDWKAPKILIAAYWIAPACIIVSWAIIGWQMAHQLDPSVPIKSNAKPIEVEVVALQWKWLFIYPQEHIATVNYIEVPVNTPVHFQLTSDDAPMNSFWIPSLGSQIYTMTGMVTQLNLIANNTGNFPGGGAEMSGEGFAGMDFNVKSTSSSEYNNWVQSVQQFGNIFDNSDYNKLTKPSSYNPPATYVISDPNLFNEIVMKYMDPHVQMYMTNSSI